MKILLVTLDFPPLRGGVARYYAGLLGALPRDSVAVITESLPKAQEFDARAPFKIFRRRLLMRWAWPRWRWIWMTILRARRAFAFDILALGNTLPLGYAALTLKAFLRIPYVVFVHGLDLLRPRHSIWKRFWVRVILRRACLVVANSEWTAGLARAYGVGSGRVVVVYPCLDVVWTPTSEEARAFRDRWNLHGRRVVLAVGRLVARKGFDMLIEAFPDVHRAHPDATVVIIGDGPERERLRHLANLRAVSDHVIFTGALSDDEIAAAYGAADIFALPTREEKDDAEGFGLVFLEAAAAGLPVVAGRSGGVPEAVADEETGILVDPRDPIAIARAVNSLLSDPERAWRMGEAGGERARHQFRWSREAKKFFDAFERHCSRA